MSNQLYPIKFKSIVKDKIWGGGKLKSVLNKKSELENLGESWELSGVQGDVSEVANGFLAGNSLEEIIEVYMADMVAKTFITSSEPNSRFFLNLSMPTTIFPSRFTRMTNSRKSAIMPTEKPRCGT